MKHTMMKKMLTMLTGCITAVAMTMPFTGMAVDSPTADVAPAHKLTESAEVANIPIMKDIVMFNAHKEPIYSPNIVYSYSITPAEVTDASISTKDSDDKPVVLSVRPGEIKAITALNDSGKGNANSMAGTNDDVRNGTITFSSNHNTMKSTNGINDQKYKAGIDYKFRNEMDIVIDASKIYDVPNANGVQDGVQDNGPGVYRYMITETTTDETYAQSGVTEGAAGDVIYLDVYTKYNDDSNGLLIYGYVLLKETVDGGNTSITYNETTQTETLKIEGFVTESEGDDNGDGELVPQDFIGDRYMTYNVDIKKIVSGDLADRHHPFPFQIVLSNNTIRSLPDFYLTDGATHAVTNLSSTGGWDSEDFKDIDAANASPTYTPIDFGLEHEEKLTLIGLPAGTLVSVTETNDTNDIYTASVTFNSTPKTVKSDDKTGNSLAIEPNKTASMNAAELINTGTENDVIIFTNSLSDISVTGLLFDIAPFIFMTAAGAILLFVFLKSKKSNDQDPVI